MINNETELMERIREAEQVIIYGAGLWGTVLSRALCTSGDIAKVLCFAVTSTTGNRSDIMGVPVCELSELTDYKDTSLVLVAAIQQDEMLDYAKQNGFVNTEPLSRLCYAQLRQKHFDYSAEILADTHFFYKSLNSIAGSISYQINRLERSIHDRINTLSTLVLEEEVERVNTAAFSEYEGCYRGREIVVMGTGPSLNDYEPIDGAIHIGVNKTCFYEKVQLDYYFAQDFFDKVHYGEEREKYLSRIADLKCKRFIGKYMQHCPHLCIELLHDEVERVAGTRYYADISSSHLIYSDISKHPLMDFHSIIFPALHFALYTKPKRIYVVGCDGSETTDKGVKEYRYFHGSVLSVQPNSTLDSNVVEHRKGHAKVNEYVKHFQPETEMISLSYGELNNIYKSGWSK